MLTLKITINKNTLQEVTLCRPEESIGRSRTCTLRLTDSSVSGLHAHIRRKGKGYILVDEGSTNGVYVNSVKIKQHDLVDGDQIRLGRVGLLVSSFSGKPTGTKKKASSKSPVKAGKKTGVVMGNKKKPIGSKS